MTDVQEIFDRVIDKGYHNTSRTHSAMCNSLASAWNWDDVSEDEYQFAIEQIKEYLLPTDCAFLQEALEKAGLPSTIEARTAIYRDWAHRPNLVPRRE